MGQKGCCRVEGRQLSEHVTLGVLTKAVPVAVVDEVLQQAELASAAPAAARHGLLRDGSDALRARLV